MNEAATTTPKLIGISRLHPLTVLRAKVDGQPAYVGQNIRVTDGGVIGGTFAPVYSDRTEDANALADSMAEAWNERAEQLRGQR